jgi:hypothetical protein
MSAIRAANSDGLLRWSVVSAATILSCYLWWAIGLPDAFAPVFVFALGAQFVAYIVLRPTSDDWPVKLMLAALLIISISIPTAAWDARSIWLFHAKRIWIDRNLYSQLDGYTSWSHPDYPLLVPALTASLAKFVGTWNEIFPKAATVLVSMPPVLLLTASLRSPTRKLVFACIVVLIAGRALVNGYIDGLLALYFAAAALVASAVCRIDGEESAKSTDRHWLTACGILLFAILALLKNEGSVALLTLGLAALIAALRETRGRDLLRLWIMVVVAFVPIACWKIACIRSGIESNLAESGVLDRMFTRLVRPQDWFAIADAMLFRASLIIPVVLLLAEAWFRGVDRTLRYFAVAAVLYSAAIALVYFSTPSDLRWHLSTSAERVMQPVILLLLFACAKLLNLSVPGLDSSSDKPVDSMQHREE